MAASITRLCGEEWQQWANSLLSCHYGPTEYQRVPDNDRGDSGIEGFTVTDGHAYQAYGCEEPLATAARYAKQRDKMTADVGKFITNRATLQRLFGTIRVTRWALFVPYSDSKEIVGHAATKTTEVVAASLPYVADSFRVVVCQEEDFRAARDQLLSNSTSALHVEADSPTVEQVSDWAATHDTLAATLTDKLRRLTTIRNEDDRGKFHTQVLKWYLEGQDILDGLREYPEVYEKVVQAKLHRENFLAAAAISGEAPHELFTASIKTLKDTFQAEVKALHAFNAESLAHEAVADWLLRCPLDFPEVATNA
jgi:hypothetical protein